ncbi:hypothetical protein Tco_0151463 [Tanacetum coccineum]
MSRKSNEMVDKIDKVLKRRKQLRRLDEYVEGRPKTVNPRTFVRPILLEDRIRIDMELDLLLLKWVLRVCSSSSIWFIYSAELTRGGAVDWESVKQSTIAMSSTEVEYIAASEAIMEVVLMRKFIDGLGVFPTNKEPIKILCDNTGAIIISNEPNITKGARHYQRKYHYI